MQELEDTALLRKYVDEGSEAAFAALVTRHVNKVYSVALRHTGNPHEAEEITQAVFVILARQSRQLGQHVLLSGWLYQTARLTAMTFIRRALRRARREQEAFMQNESNVWKQIAPLLDTAMAGLNEPDRHAVVLRFFDGKSMMDIAGALGTNEVTARKRVGRALEKLRKYFSTHGVHSTTDTIARAISFNSVQTAPALLAQTATTAALAKGAAAGSSILTLAKTTLIAMKTKTIVATVATTLIIAGIATWFASFHLFQPPNAAPPAAIPSGLLPIKFANDNFTPGDNPGGRFMIGVDPGTRRNPDSEPAIHIKGPIAANDANQNSDNSSYAVYQVTNGSPLLGRHIHITGWLKTSNAGGWASGFLVITAKDKGSLVNDTMNDRPILGTTDWQQIELVTDVPQEPCVIYFGPDLYGPGELWGDDFQLDLAPRNEPITDDRTWRHTSQSPNTYSEALDFQNQHDGHPVICLTYTPDQAAARGSWTWWGQMIRPPEIEKYTGHTVRLTGWVKTENVSDRLEPAIRPWIRDANGWKLLAQDSMVNDHSLRGTRDWTKFSVTCVIPKQLQHIENSLVFWGSGQVWIDTESLKYEIIK